MASDSHLVRQRAAECQPTDSKWLCRAREQGNHLISAVGRTAHAQTDITPGDQLPSSGVKNFLKDGVANRLGAVEEKVVQPYVALGVTILRA